MSDDYLMASQGPIKRPPAQQIITSIRAIPSLPQIMARLLEVTKNDKANASTIEKIIKHDQSLTSNILFTANSAFYGSPSKVNSIQRAVVLLGHDEVRKICLGTNLLATFRPCIKVDPDGSEKMWKHALLTAEAATMIAEKVRTVEAEQAYTAGLMHDLGKVVMVVFLIKNFPRIALDGVPLWKKAETMFDIEHQEIGLALAEHWKLPPMLGEVMGRHHVPSSNLVYSKEVAIVHLADCLTHFIDGDGPTMPQPQALKMLNLGHNIMNTFLGDLAKRVPLLEDMWEGIVM